MKKDDAHRLCSEAQEVIGLRAVQAIVGGMKQVEAVRVFGVSRYREGGLKALRAWPRGRPKGQGLLKGWQAAQVVRTITDPAMAGIR